MIISYPVTAASLIYSQKSVYLFVVAAAGAYIDPWSPFKAAFVKASNLPPPLCGNFQPWKIGIQGGFGRIFSYVYYGILTGPRPYQLLSIEWRYASSLSVISLLELELADFTWCRYVPIFSYDDSTLFIWLLLNLVRVVKVKAYFQKVDFLING